MKNVMRIYQSLILVALRIVSGNRNPAGFNYFHAGFTIIVRE
ncbi:hypothetical protein [Rossellomorea sp. SC111]|nr:hypothetical protein [Rossellomorea sp. SC111]